MLKREIKKLRAQNQRILDKIGLSADADSQGNSTDEEGNVRPAVHNRRFQKNSNDPTRVRKEENKRSHKKRRRRNVVQENREEVLEEVKGPIQEIDYKSGEDLNEANIEESKDPNPIERDNKYLEDLGNANLNTQHVIPISHNSYSSKTSRPPVTSRTVVNTISSLSDIFHSHSELHSMPANQALNQISYMLAPAPAPVPAPAPSVSVPLVITNQTNNTDAGNPPANSDWDYPSSYYNDGNPPPSSN
jgi:hypothetical protein